MAPPLCLAALVLIALFPPPPFALNPRTPATPAQLDADAAVMVKVTPKKLRFPLPPRLPVSLPSPVLGRGARAVRQCQNPTCKKDFDTRTSSSPSMFSGMSVFCSSRCASKVAGVVVKPEPRGAPLEPAREHASFLAASRALGTAREKLAKRGFSTFAAVAATPGGRVVSSVGVGKTADGRPDRAGALAAIVAAVMTDPKRVRAALAKEKAVRAAAALTVGGAMDVVRAVDSAALPGLLVRAYAVLRGSSRTAARFGTTPFCLTPPPSPPAHTQQNPPAPPLSARPHRRRQSSRASRRLRS
jgi:hypothetical protein